MTTTSVHTLRVARRLRPGTLIWVDGPDPVRVLAVLPRRVNRVTIFTESDGTVGQFTCGAEDRFRSCPGTGSWVYTGRALDRIFRWHRERGLLCCLNPGGPFCEASISHAYDELRRWLAARAAANSEVSR